MIDRNQLFSFTLLLLTSLAYGEAARCPANIAPLQYHSLQHAQIAVPVTINGSGPYEFMVDTGAQITVIDSALADHLQLTPKGSIGVIAVTNFANLPLVSAGVVEAGQATVRDLHMVAEHLGQFQAENPALRGILGENFLSHFDLLIDNRHKTLCLDETTHMQRALQGEHIPILISTDRMSDLSYAQPILISVYLDGDGPKRTILRVDSGANVPLLFGSYTGILPWLKMATARRGSVAGSTNTISFATMHPQEMRIGARLTRQVTFVTPIDTGRRFARAGEDGLLPTTFFSRVFISYSDGFVIFDPRA